ncbi:MAG TPA: tyrosine-type recombinase/integrase [Chloroflexota bacterium]
MSTTEPDSSAPPAIQAEIDLFVRSLAGKSPATINTYRNALARFLDFLGESHVPAGHLAASLPADILEQFYAWLVDNYGRERRATTTTYVAGVRAFFRFLARRRLLSPDTSFEQVRAGLQEVMGKGSYKTPRIDRGLPLIVLYVNQVPLPEPVSERARTKRLETFRDRAIIHTLFSTGMRREEVSRLDRQDLEDGYASQALITGKGDKERVVFFSEEALAAIREYLVERSDHYTPLFIRHDRRRGQPLRGGQNFRLAPRGIWWIVKTYASLAGVDATTHDFRHSKASTMLNRGAKLSEVQDILGHSSPETTKKIYAHYEVSHLRSAFERYSATAEELAAEIEPRGDRRSIPDSPARRPDLN